MKQRNNAAKGELPFDQFVQYLGVRMSCGRVCVRALMRRVAIRQLCTDITFYTRQVTQHSTLEANIIQQVRVRVSLLLLVAAACCCLLLLAVACCCCLLLAARFFVRTRQLIRHSKPDPAIVANVAASDPRHKRRVNLVRGLLPPPRPEVRSCVWNTFIVEPYTVARRL